MTDYFSDAATLPGVAAAASDARSAVDAVLWDRQVRAHAAPLADLSWRRAAAASAYLDGALLSPDSTPAVDDDSPMGAVVLATTRTFAAARSLAAAPSAPPALQAWARLHAMYAGSGDPDAGRPRTGTIEAPEDPLRLGTFRSPAESARRLAALARALQETTTAPGVVVAAMVHAEIAWCRPFARGSGAVARAAARLVLSQRGVDPDGITVAERGLAQSGRPTYARALQAYGSATPDGVATWLLHACATTAAGAAYVADLLAEVRAGPGR